MRKRNHRGLSDSEIEYYNLKYSEIPNIHKVSYHGLYTYHHGERIPLVIQEYQNKSKIQAINKAAAIESIQELLSHVRYSVYGIA